MLVSIWSVKSNRYIQKSLYKLQHHGENISLIQTCSGSGIFLTDNSPSVCFNQCALYKCTQYCNALYSVHTTHGPQTLYSLFANFIMHKYKWDENPTKENRDQIHLPKSETNKEEIFGCMKSYIYNVNVRGIPWINIFTMQRKTL